MAGNSTLKYLTAYLSLMSKPTPELIHELESYVHSSSELDLLLNKPPLKILAHKLEHKTTHEAKYWIVYERIDGSQRDSGPVLWCLFSPT